MSIKSSGAIGFNPEAVFFDLDGTAVPNGAVTAPNDLIKAVTESDIRMVPVSGRTLEDGEDLVKSLGVNAFVLDGGTWISARNGHPDIRSDWDFYDPEIYKEGIPEATARKLWSICSTLFLPEEVVEEFGRKVVSVGKKKTGVDLLESSFSEEFDASDFFRAIACMWINCDANGLYEPGERDLHVEVTGMDVLEALFIRGGSFSPCSFFVRNLKEPEHAELLADLINEETNGEAMPSVVKSQNPGLYDVHTVNRLGTKLSAVSWVAKGVFKDEFDLSRCVAVGDGHNDIPMLEAVGHAVVMGDAPEEVKAVADEVIAPQSEGGFLDLLSRFK